MKIKDAIYKTQGARFRILKAKNLLTGILYQLLWLAPVVTSIQSCNKGTIPAYVYIPSISVTGNTGIYGSNSSNITDAWYYQVNNLQGAYQLPARFPVIGSGTDTVHIIAGIEANGIAATRIEYPLYNYYSVILKQVPDKTDTIRPVVTYLDSTKVAFINDFEGGDIFSNINTITNPVFEGRYSGQVNVPATATTVSCLTATSYAIPNTSPAVFLEMNYMCNYPFTMGLNLYNAEAGLTQPYDIETLNAQSPPAWNKIYINLTPSINQNVPDSVAVYFYVAKSNLTDVPLIYFDNIKLLYLNP